MKIKENNLFTYLVDYMIELLESGTSIKDISDLINHTLMFRHTDLDLINKYNELWEETLNELSTKVRQLVMFRLKLLYEQRMKERHTILRNLRWQGLMQKRNLIS